MLISSKKIAEFWRHGVLVKEPSSFSWKRWLLSLHICGRLTFRT